MTVGTRIVKAREALGWKRPQLATQAGVPYPTLSGLENGDQQSSAWIPAIAHATGVSALWLATGKGAMRAGGESNSERAGADPDFEKISGAVVVLREYLELLGKPAQWVADPELLATAYKIVVEFGNPTDQNVLDLTKRIAERLRAEATRNGRGDTIQGARGDPSATHRKA